MDAKHLLSKNSSKSTSYLFKQYLNLIEDLKFQHLEYVKRLKANIPETYHPIINSAEYLDDARVSWIRKRVLDLGNECMRAQETDLQDYSVGFVFKN